MRETPEIPKHAEPEFILIISRHASRQTAIKALIRSLLPVTPIYTTENFPETNQYPRAREGSRVLAVIDGWSFNDCAMPASDLIRDHAETLRGHPEMRCLYLVNHAKGIKIRETDRVLGGDITSNEFIDTIRVMLE
jgi:DNA-binding NarL/FixJ family response regulator